MRTLDDIGAAIERQLDSVEHRFAEQPFGSAVLGGVLAFGVIGGGIATFIMVLVVLVKLFA